MSKKNVALVSKRLSGESVINCNLELWDFVTNFTYFGAMK